MSFDLPPLDAADASESAIESATKLSCLQKNNFGHTKAERMIMKKEDEHKNLNLKLFE